MDFVGSGNLLGVAAAASSVGGIGSGSFSSIEGSSHNSHNNNQNQNDNNNVNINSNLNFNFNDINNSGSSLSATAAASTSSISTTAATATSSFLNNVAANLALGGSSGASSSANSGSSGTTTIIGENGPIIFSEPNRTSAIDDIRSVVLYIFIITIFFSFFLILPGIRNDKFPTFLCITTSLFVASIILISLFGTSWHVGEAPISAAYKAFSRDRIQGELSVNIGLQSVNITLRAHKYYILHNIKGPMIMYNMVTTATATAKATTTATTTSNNNNNNQPSSILNVDEDEEEREEIEASLNGEKINVRSSGIDSELEVEEVFPQDKTNENHSSFRRTRSNENLSKKKKRSSSSSSLLSINNNKKKQKFTIERVNVDINYNERFYFIEPNQMRQEHQSALERGLPYPILTVVEYLSQDEAGFNWSRQYRAAGYYSYIMLWLSFCVCILMFFLHCAAPKYGIYTMQILGALLILTNFTYANLVPKGDRKLVIPFEGQSLTFKFGWNFWAVLIGGSTSLLVGTIIVIIDKLFPNFIFTTILDVDFDSHNKYYKHKGKKLAYSKHVNDNHNSLLALQQSTSSTSSSSSSSSTNSSLMERPKRPPFFNYNNDSNNSSPNLSNSSSTISSVASISANKLEQNNCEKKGENENSIQNRIFSNPSKQKHLATTTTTTTSCSSERRNNKLLSSATVTIQQTESQNFEDHHSQYNEAYEGEEDDIRQSDDISNNDTATNTTIDNKKVNLKSMHQQATTFQPLIDNNGQHITTTTTTTTTTHNNSLKNKKNANRFQRRQTNDHFEDKVIEGELSHL